MTDVFIIVCLSTLSTLFVLLGVYLVPRPFRIRILVDVFVGEHRCMRVRIKRFGGPVWVFAEAKEDQRAYQQTYSWCYEATGIVLNRDIRDAITGALQGVYIRQRREAVVQDRAQRGQLSHDVESQETP